MQTTLGEQILDVAIAERETQIEPNGVPDGGLTPKTCHLLQEYAPAAPSEPDGRDLAGS